MRDQRRINATLSTSVPGLRRGLMPLLVTALVVAGLFCAIHVASPSEAEARPRAAIPDKLWTETQPTETGLSGESPVTMGAFAKLAKLISPAVVNIHTAKMRTNTDVRYSRETRRKVVSASGTGFFIHADGYILTNNHVIEGAMRIRVRTADDRTFQARVIGRDRRTDLALLKVDAATKFVVVPLGNSDAVDIGSWVVAIGNPYGLGHTVTAGIVSAKGRSNLRPGPTRYANFIQTDASINPGNSGGPLVNIRGEVIGINTAILGKAQGIGFAIPSNMAKKLVPQLARGHVERSWLGLSVGEVTPEVARSLRLDRAIGAYVRFVAKGSPAVKAGLRPGDVIVKFGKHVVRKSTDLPWLAASGGVGKQIQLSFIRRGKPMAATVVLAALPSRFGGVARKKRPAPPSRRRDIVVPGLGMRVTQLTSALRKRFRIVARSGVLILHVDRGGPAGAAGLRPGDVIVQADRRRVDTVRDLLQVNGWYPAREMVPLYVARGQDVRFVMPKKSR